MTSAAACIGRCIFTSSKPGLNAQEELTGWRHVIVGQSIMAGTLIRGHDQGRHRLHLGRRRGDASPTTIPNIAVDLATTKTGVPVLWWRVVGSSHTTFAVEAFIDEVAHAAGEDPFAFRRKLLEHEPRMKAVLELAAEKAGWSSGRCRRAGAAASPWPRHSRPSSRRWPRSASMMPAASRSIGWSARSTAAPPINPDIIAAQMEGGIGFGSGRGAVWGDHAQGGPRRAETTSTDYRVLRMNEMPKVEVHIVPSTEAPTGVGEPGVAPVGPAVANAIFAATGKRMHMSAVSADRRARS